MYDFKSYGNQAWTDHGRIMYARLKSVSEVVPRTGGLSFLNQAAKSQR